MTAERFSELASAYGADPRRWPAAERAAALAWMAGPANGMATAAALADAAALDRMLSAHRVAPASEALRRRVEAGAAPARSRAGRWTWWWSGAGLASAGLAGALAGSVLVSAFRAEPMPSAPATWSYAVTAFGEPAADWSDE